MSNPASEVSELIKALNEGSLSLQEVARQFRERTWPATRPPRPDSYLEMASQAMQDPGPEIPGSFDDVAAAYYRGELTEDQYEVLSKAFADSKRRSG